MSSVDVVVPCYNYGRFLRACVNSIRSQRDVDLRILIIDDMSADTTEEVGTALAAADERVTFIRHAKNQGHIKTFNEGIMDWASAKYTLLISADDALAAGALARAAYVMDHHEEVSMTYGKARIVRGESLPPDIDEPETLDYAIIPGPRFLQRSCVWNPVLSPTAVVRTELQQRTGGYSPKMLHTSDMEMWMRLATFSSIGAVEAVQGHYRWHGANMNVQYGSGVLGDRRQRLETCEYVFEQWGGSSVQGFASWIAESRKALALDAYWLAGLAVERSDEAGTREYLAFADACDPSLRGSRHAWRLKAKRLLGPTLTRTIRGVLGRTDRLEMTDPEPGWWPDADEPFIQIVRAPNADTRCAASQAPQKANATWR